MKYRVELTNWLINSNPQSYFQKLDFNPLALMHIQENFASGLLLEIELVNFTEHFFYQLFTIIDRCYHFHQN